MKLDRHQQGIMLIGVAMLMVAVITVLSIGQPLVVNDTQLPNFFVNYQYGYVHRGLLGSILSVLFGDFTRAQIDLYAPLFQRGLAIFLMILLWLGLIPKIALSQSYSPPMRWWLLAFSSVLLVAPIWKMESNWFGFMDVYIFFTALLAGAALIARRLLWFAILLLIMQMFHRGGFLMSFSLSIMAVYAAWFSPAFFRKRKKWLAAAVFPAIFFVLANWLHNSEHTARILAEANIYDSTTLETILAGAAGGLRLVQRQLTLYFVDYPNIFIWHVIIFALPPFLLSALFFWFRKKTALGFWDRPNAPDFPPPEKWMLKMEFFIPVAAAMTSLPITLVAVDIARLMFWGWFNLSLITVCQLWIFSAPQKAGVKTTKRVRKRQKREHQKPATLWATTILLASLAYTYAGSPWHNSHIGYVAFLRCTQYCIPLINNNPLASYYNNFVSRKLSYIHYPLHFDAVKSRHAFLPFEKNVSLRDNGIVIPASSGDLLVRRASLVMPPKAKITFKASYTVEDFDGSAPLILEINGEKISPQLITAEHSEWRVQFGQYPIIAGLRLRSNHPQSFILSSFVIDRSSAP
ncbi:MAG: hypothetical protein ACR2PV_07565 [Gammaproteobacteria bacterium]